MLAVQVRTGDSQAKNATVQALLFDYFDRCVDLVTKGSGTQFRLFVTTDSNYIVERFEAIYPNMLTFVGDIIHIDGSFGSSNDMHASFEKLVLDHITLSQADKLIISRSGFGEIAAVRGFRPYHPPGHCAVRPVPHYSFPSDIPQAVPGDDINAIDEILRSAV